MENPDFCWKPPSVGCMTMHDVVLRPYSAATRSLILGWSVRTFASGRRPRGKPEKRPFGEVRRKLRKVTGASPRSSLAPVEPCFKPRVADFAQRSPAPSVCERRPAASNPGFQTSLSEVQRPENGKSGKVRR